MVIVLLLNKRLFFGSLDVHFSNALGACQNLERWNQP